MDFRNYPPIWDPDARVLVRDFSSWPLKFRVWGREGKYSIRISNQVTGRKFKIGTNGSELIIDRPVEDINAVINKALGMTYMSFVSETESGTFSQFLLS